MLSGAERFAIYATPAPGSALAHLGAAWLGRDAASGAGLERPPLPGLDPAEAEAITENPRFYGFHGTLKAPFALAAGMDRVALMAAVRRLAARREGFALPPLRVASLGGFIALLPAAPCPALDALAAACVRALDGLRAPAPPEEVARRKAAGLNRREAELLDLWGYPFVLDAFRFHMTLTGRIDDEARRAPLVAALSDLFAPALEQPGPLDALSVFHQPDRATPFRIIERVRLGARV
jgi:putative phosphonate metabolism protein